jgi:hypothetical protein
MAERKSIARAITIGQLWVGLPPVLIMVVGTLAALVWAMGRPQNAGTGTVLVPFLAGYIAANAVGWLWWSLMIPKWRLWALQRTGDWPALEKAAIKAKLIWDESTRTGRFFSRTEIATAEGRRRFAELKLAATPAAEI